jgi:quercetin dioxygenase-like cupin family protein
VRKIETADRLVVNIREAAFKPFVTEGQEVKGHSFLQLDESFPEGVGFHIYRMAPGTWSQPHEHTCAEQFLVLEGDVRDNDGYVYRPGDFVLLKQGTQHNSYTEHGATLVVFIASLERNL